MGRLERHQLWVYVLAILVGLGLGALVPEVGPSLELAVWPALALLLYATFTQVPLLHLPGLLSDRRFVVAVLVGNFLILPLVVWALLVLVPADPAVRFGVLLVLLVPCTDWFITFTHLAGGDTRRAIAITPVNLLLQLALLPLYLWFFLGETFTQIGGRGITVFAVLILLPLLAAWLTRRFTGRTPVSASTHAQQPRSVVDRLGLLPVPLLGLVVFLVAASQVATVADALALLPRLTVVYATFLVVAAVLGRAVTAVLHLDPAPARTVLFSYGTRNSFVVLPVALAAPDGWQIAAVVVVYQSLVELFGMVGYLWAVPRLVPSAAAPFEPR